MIKPDGVQRGLIGDVISRFEKRGFKLCAIKMSQPGKKHMEKHYQDLKDKKFFPGLIEYATSGPVCAMIWEGDNVVLTGRKMLGATKPFDSRPGTIRGDFCIDVGRNIIHGSDAVESAKAEIELWFPKKERNDWRSHSGPWIYEDEPADESAPQAKSASSAKGGAKGSASGGQGAGGQLLKLYTNGPGHFYYYNAKMTADYCGYPVQVVMVDPEMAKEQALKDKKGTGSFPFLELADGTIIRESNAIAAFIARTAGQPGFLGSNAAEEGQVEQFLAWTSRTVGPNMQRHTRHVWGWDEDPKGAAESAKALKEAAVQLNAHLDGKSWLTGSRLTLADIVVFNALLAPFSYCFDPGFQKAIPRTCAWFEKISKLPFVARSAGFVKMMGFGAGKQQAQAPAAGKKAKGGKQEQPKKEEKPKPAPKADKHGDDDDDEFDPFAEGDDDEKEAVSEICMSNRAFHSI